MQKDVLWRQWQKQKNFPVLYVKCFLLLYQKTLVNMLDNIAIAAKLILTEARTESNESHHLTHLLVEPN